MRTRNRFLPVIFVGKMQNANAEARRGHPNSGS